MKENDSKPFLTWLIVCVFNAFCGLTSSALTECKSAHVSVPLRGQLMLSRAVFWNLRHNKHNYQRLNTHSLSCCTPHITPHQHSAILREYVTRINYGKMRFLHSNWHLITYNKFVRSVAGSLIHIWRLSSV